MSSSARALVLLVPLLLALRIHVALGTMAYVDPKYVSVKDPNSGRVGSTPWSLLFPSPSRFGPTADAGSMRLCASVDEVIAAFLDITSSSSFTVSNANFTGGKCPQWGIVDTWATGSYFSTLFSAGKAIVFSSGYAGEANGIFNDNEGYSLDQQGVGDSDLDAL